MRTKSRQFTTMRRIKVSFRAPADPPVHPRRVHPSTVNTYQPYSPIGLDLELLERPQETPPEVPIKMVPLIPEAPYL